MEKKIELAKHANCTGCAVCHDVCPTRSIKMQWDGLQRFPFINSETCILCGKCIKVCPSISLQEIKTCDQTFYCAWNKNSENRQASTSGGVGSAMVETAINMKFAVCGAAFDSNWHLSHRIVVNQEDALQFRGSKYLQSDTVGIFTQVKQFINEGYHVLFIGTPCQVEEARRLLLPAEQDYLVTCGIICHGVNSPKVWEDYVDYLNKKHHSSLVSYNFRSKKNGWGEYKRGGAKLRVSYQMANGKSYDEPAWRNLFHVWFGKHYMMRESCFHCPYRKQQRSCDITIGDFWGLKRVLPDIVANQGASVVITSTCRGENFLNSCGNIHLIKVDGEKTSKILKGFLDTRDEIVKTKEILRMKKFEKEYVFKGIDQMSKRYPVQTFFERILAAIKFRLYRH